MEETGLYGVLLKLRNGEGSGFDIEEKIVAITNEEVPEDQILIDYRLRNKPFSEIPVKTLFKKTEEVFRAGSAYETETTLVLAGYEPFSVIVKYSHWRMPADFYDEGYYVVKSKGAFRSEEELLEALTGSQK